MNGNVDHTQLRLEGNLDGAIVPDDNNVGGVLLPLPVDPDLLDLPGLVDSPVPSPPSTSPAASPTPLASAFSSSAGTLDIEFLGLSSHHEPTPLAPSSPPACYDPPTPLEVYCYIDDCLAVPASLPSTSPATSPTPLASALSFLHEPTPLASPSPPEIYDPPTPLEVCCYLDDYLAVPATPAGSLAQGASPSTEWVSREGNIAVGLRAAYFAVPVHHHLQRLVRVLARVGSTADPNVGEGAASADSVDLPPEGSPDRL